MEKSLNTFSADTNFKDSFYLEVFEPVGKEGGLTARDLHQSLYPSFPLCKDVQAS